MFVDVWSENTALFERLTKIHSNPPKLYYGFNFKMMHNVNNGRHGNNAKVGCHLHNGDKSMSELASLHAVIIGENSFLLNL